METKICKTCGIEKSIEDFYLRSDRIGARIAYCKVCSNETVTSHRKKKTERLQQYKESFGCLVCGLRIGVALDFHHLDPAQKEASIANLFMNHASWEVIMAETKKCIVICSNHHRMLHAGLIELPLDEKE